MSTKQTWKRGNRFLSKDQIIALRDKKPEDVAAEEAKAKADEAPAEAPVTQGEDKTDETPVEEKKKEGVIGKILGKK